MKDIDVFIDLESLGIGSPLFRLVGEGNNVKTLLKKLPAALEREGYRPRLIWGTACVMRRNGRLRLPGKFQIALKQIFTRYNGVMFWSNEIADEALKKKVRKFLAAGTLAESVLLVASDHDFGALVAELVASGRFVLVSGNQVSKRLARVASKTLSLAELCLDVSEAMIAEPEKPFNFISWP